MIQWCRIDLAHIPGRTVKATEINMSEELAQKIHVTFIFPKYSLTIRYMPYRCSVTKFYNLILDNLQF